jgi:hypothetical protein
MKEDRLKRADIWMQYCKLQTIKWTKTQLFSVFMTHLLYLFRRWVSLLCSVSCCWVLQYWVSLCLVLYTYCHYSYTYCQNAESIISVIMQSVVMLSVTVLGVIMFSVLILTFNILSVKMLSLDIMSIVMLSVILLTLIMLGVKMLLV